MSYLNDDQQALRDRTNGIIEKYGSPKSFIAYKINITPPHFLFWLKGDRRLSADKLEKLEAFLNG